MHWVVEFVPCETTRAIPRGLSRHRQAQARRTSEVDKLLSQLARTLFADVSSHQVQVLVHAMEKNGYKAASIHLQRAQLRSLFNYARQVWYWSVPGGNPASGLKMPTVDNQRTRVLSNSEWKRLCDALATCGNEYVVPALAMLLDTAMRSSEALVKVEVDPSVKTNTRQV